MSVETRRLVGGALCLDFANSVDWASDGSERGAHADVMAAPEDLVSWARRVGLPSPPSVTGREHTRVRALRRAVHDVFRAIATGATPGDAALERVARAHTEAVRAARLGGAGRGWQLEWSADDGRRLRFAVAVSAVDLLRDEARLARLRICPGNNCGWLFLDFTGRRRWCSMEVCGSRAKMRRLYARKRAGSRRA